MEEFVPSGTAYFEKELKGSFGYSAFSFSK